MAVQYARLSDSWKVGGKFKTDQRLAIFPSLQKKRIVKNPPPPIVLLAEAAWLRFRSTLLQFQRLCS